MPTHPTQVLAEHFSGVRFETLPDSVRDHVTDVLIDTVANAFIGRKKPETAKVEALASLIGGPATATVIGGPRNSLVGATLLNGFQAASVASGEETTPLMSHAATTVAPALAVTEVRGAAGGDLIVAIAIGIEIAGRVGAGMNIETMRSLFWDPPGVLGPLASSAAVASILKLDPRRFQNALSLAGTQSAGTAAQMGTSTMQFQHARSGMSGVLAAFLAETGFKAGPEILTASHGGLLHMFSDGGDPATVIAGLGENWLLKTPGSFSTCTLSRPELLAKLRQATDGFLSEHDTQRAIDMLEGLSQLADVSALCATLGGSQNNAIKRSGSCN